MWAILIHKSKLNKELPVHLAEIPNSSYLFKHRIYEGISVEGLSGPVYSPHVPPSLLAPEPQTLK